MSESHLHFLRPPGLRRFARGCSLKARETLESALFMYEYWVDLDSLAAVIKKCHNNSRGEKAPCQAQQKPHPGDPARAWAVW